MKEYLYAITSKKISISIVPYFSIEHSFPELDHYVWEYRITVKNKQNKIINILKQNWSIVDSLGRNIVLKNDQIQKEKSFLNPREEYEYVQLAPLSAPMGMMQGWYDIEDDEGNTFKARTPTVSLNSPFHDFMKN